MVRAQELVLLAETLALKRLEDCLAHHRVDKEDAANNKAFEGSDRVVTK